VTHPRGKQQGLADVGLGEVRKCLKEIFLAVTCRKGTDDRVNRQPSPSDDGLSHQRLRIHDDTFELIHVTMIAQHRWTAMAPYLATASGGIVGSASGVVVGGQDANGRPPGGRRYG